MYKINIFNILILLGSLQGFMLSALFFSIKKLNRKSNIFLALLLISFSMVNLANCLWDIGFSKQFIFLQYLPLNCTLLIPFALYYFVQFLIDPSYQFGNKELLLLVPFSTQLILKLAQLILFLRLPERLQQWQIYFKAFTQILEVVAIIYCVLVFILSIKKINQFEQQLQNQFADIERRSLAWIKNILTKVAFLLALWIVPYVFAATYNTDVNLYMYPLWLGMTMIIYWLAWSMFSRRDLFEYSPPEVFKISNQPISDIIVEPQISKEKNIRESWEQHFLELERLMKEERLYLDFEINMTSLAEKMGLSNGYLSQIINQVEGQNFYDFINTYRVKAVQEKLADPAFNHLSIYGISLDCGFKSKSTFNAVFKKVTGMTPSAYKNQLYQSPAP